jgi:hypothetical protein
VPFVFGVSALAALWPCVVLGVLVVALSGYQLYTRAKPASANRHDESIGGIGTWLAYAAATAPMLMCVAWRNDDRSAEHPAALLTRMAVHH